MNVGATTQGDGIIALITTYGIEILLSAIALVLVIIGIAVCRRTQSNSRDNQKKF